MMRSAIAKSCRNCRFNKKRTAQQEEKATATEKSDVFFFALKRLPCMVLQILCNSISVSILQVFYRHNFDCMIALHKNECMWVSYNSAITTCGMSYFLIIIYVVKLWTKFECSFASSFTLFSLHPPPHAASVSSASKEWISLCKGSYPQRLHNQTAY